MLQQARTRPRLPRSLGHESVVRIELAAAYDELWEIETIFDEIKTHQRGSTRILRSKSPDLVEHPRTLLAGVPDVRDRDVFVCGPPGMTAAVLRSLRARWTCRAGRSTPNASASLDRSRGAHGTPRPGTRSPWVSHRSAPSPRAHPISASAPALACPRAGVDVGAEALTAAFAAEQSQ
jgi:hypothetical protein